MDVEVAVKIIEEDLGRRAGGREVAAGAEARGEAIEAREEGVHGEREWEMSESSSAATQSAARARSGPRLMAMLLPALTRVSRPTCATNQSRVPGVLGGRPDGVDGVVQHQPRRGLPLPLGAAALLPHGRRAGPEPDGGAPPAATAGTAAESGGGGRPHRRTRAAHGGGGESDSPDRRRWRRTPRLADGEAASCAAASYVCIYKNKILG